MPHKDYVTATLELISSGLPPEDVVRGLKETLAARHHEALYGRVLATVLRVLEAKDGLTVVKVAKEADLTQHKEAITQALASLGSTTTEPAITIDDTLIGGYVVEHNRNRIDNTYKTKLVDLYRRVTH